MKKNVLYKSGWLSALLLALIILSVHTELTKAGMVSGCLLTPIVSTLLALCASAVGEKNGVRKYDIAAVAVGSSVTAVVFLFAYWMGVLNAA